MAICLSGLMRSYEDCYRQFHSAILKQNTCDLFISTWDCLGYDALLNPDDHEQVIYSTEGYNLVKSEDLISRYKPYVRMVRIESLDDFNQKHLNHKRLHRIERNMYAMYYKIKDCFELVKQYETAISQQQGCEFRYDYVMRIRPDLYFLRELPLRPEIWKFRDTHYAFPENRIFGGVNDQVGVGRRDIMERASSLWDFMDEYMQLGLNIPGCAESLLRTHLTKMNIPYQSEGHPSQNMHYVLMRMHHPLEGKS